MPVESIPPGKHMSQASHIPKFVALNQRMLRTGQSEGASPWWALGFLFLLIGFQVGLVVLGGTPLRLPLRTGAFGASLALAVLVRSRQWAHPSYRIAIWVAVMLAVSLLHPERNSLAAAVAQ